MRIKDLSIEKFSIKSFPSKASQPKALPQRIVIKGFPPFRDARPKSESTVPLDLEDCDTKTAVFLILQQISGAAQLVNSSYSESLALLVDSKFTFPPEIEPKRSSSAESAKCKKNFRVKEKSSFPKKGRNQASQELE